MLDDTLVVWGGEFGRAVYSQGTLTDDNYGRDHHPRSLSWRLSLTMDQDFCVEALKCALRRGWPEILIAELPPAEWRFARNSGPLVHGRP